ncbi:MAG: alcohol dehydrogenase, partial [Chloroflexota bacterium]
MKALVFKGVNQPFSYEEVANPEAEDGWVVVEVKAAAFNHRDNWITKGMYPNMQAIADPAILGSDGAGLVGDREVIINPNIDWGDDDRFPLPEYEILGMTERGTFAEQVKIRASHVVDKPAHLTFEQAAALPLGGLTAYRVLFSRCKAQPGEKVLISGVGGGVALFACQF